MNEPVLPISVKGVMAGQSSWPDYASKLESALAASRAECERLRNELKAIGEYALAMNGNTIERIRGLTEIHNTCNQALRQPATGGE